MLEAHAIAKRYPGVIAVRSATLRIGAGGFAAIVGRSGSGKSTLLAMLACLTCPSEGRVTLDGVDPWTLDEDGRSRYRARDVAMVFQSPSLLPNLRAIDNVALPALLARTLPHSQAYSRARDLLREVGLADREAVYPATLSGGEQRRVGIARALVNRPRVVLADEPTSDLDADTGGEIVMLLDRLRGELGFALVVATHDVSLASRADVVYAMDDAKLTRADAVTDETPALTPVRREHEAAPRTSPALGATFWPMTRRAAFGVAVAASVVLLADSMVARYQRSRLEARAERLGALETLALSQLRAGVKSIASVEPGRYELALELANASPDRAIEVTAPALRAYVQVGRQWTELPTAAVAERAASVVTVAGREVFRYRFEARPADYARLFSRYMHVRLVSTMLVSPNDSPAGDLFERNDSYYVYLKPADADDRDILREARFEGAPPLWIAMPPH